MRVCVCVECSSNSPFIVHNWSQSERVLCDTEDKGASPKQYHEKEATKYGELCIKEYNK